MLGRLIELRYNIEPLGKQSTRFRAFRGKDKDGNEKIFSHQYTPKKHKVFADAIKLMTQAQLPNDFKMFEGKVVVNKLYYVFEQIKSLRKYQKEHIEKWGITPKYTKPDLPDNLQKGLFDALSNLVFKDDAIIFGIKNAWKFWGKSPGIIVGLEEVGNNYTDFPKIYGNNRP